MDPEREQEPAQPKLDPGGGHLHAATVWATRSLQYAAVILALALYVAGPGAFAHRAKHDNDFKHMYLGMQALVEGEEPYSAQSLLLQAHRHGMPDASLNPYVYLPFTGLSLAFMASLDMRQASDLWFGISHGLALLCAWLIAAMFWPRTKPLAFGLIVLILAFSHPFYRTLTAGQLNVVLLACYVGAFAALRARRDVLAGGILGFAAMFKIAPAVFLFHFALERRWRALSAMAIACAILLAVSLVAVGPSVHADFLPALKQMRYGHSVWENVGRGATFWKDPYNQSVNSLLTHVVVSGNGVTESWFDGSQRAANGLTSAVTLTLLALWAALIVRTGSLYRNAWPSDAHEAGFQLTVLMSLLAPSLMWDHYLLVLLLPVAWAVFHCRREGLGPAAAAAVFFLGATLLPWSPESDSYRHGVMVPMMSAKLLPVLGLFLLIGGLQVRMLRRCKIAP